MAFAKRGCVCRLLCSHVDRPRPTTYMDDKAGGGLDHARRTDRHEDRAFAQCVEDALQLERHFAKPTDVRANPAPAFAPWKLRWRMVGSRVVKGRGVDF